MVGVKKNYPQRIMLEFPQFFDVLWNFFKILKNFYFIYFNESIRINQVFRISLQEFIIVLPLNRFNCFKCIKLLMESYSSLFLSFVFMLAYIKNSINLLNTLSTSAEECGTVSKTWTKLSTKISNTSCFPL